MTESIWEGKEREKDLQKDMQKMQDGPMKLLEDLITSL